MTRRLYHMKADIVKAVAHPVRLAVLDCLGRGEKCVCDITEAVGAQRSNVSRHLAVMVRAGVLTPRKEGLKVFYRLRTPCILGFLSCVEAALREQLKDNQVVLSRL